MAALRRVVLLTVLALAACARTDLGAPCHVENGAGAELVPLPGRQYLYLGSSECESFACLAMQGASGGYCSQACSGEGASCPSGLACTQLALSPDYLAAMKARLPPDRYQQLFGQLGSSWYCARSQ
ncbi:MAG: hypothetical protein AUG04_13415 [Deltaproteobacteria bacterium 13_1_20CM_2_69_21]|jgi:hypothetical protein|nr:MAG: hypothetical protein AUH83_05125 [Deltaproteobacteria bacterium 13_1_40CM_4_68_19]OLD46635.1 MAG: hypothetical protein AUI48_07305 [Chloroflexi bacterium 13_1_40CM_2_68_14]OLE61753.1 MAG: hypothetical protein AUG04_13415 [Deltaproteobacteria bacterium 13_1_20CM_2_69_21]